MTESKIDYYVYTDGACADNGKINARAGLGIYFGESDPRNVSKCVVGKQSNNVAELEAIYQTYDIIKNDLSNGLNITIVSDSAYAIGCAGEYGQKQENTFWKNNIPNKDLVKKTFLKFKNSGVKFINIKAHTSNIDQHSIGNNGADKLANLAIGLTCCPYAKENKIYLNVPFNKKDEVKNKGAKWDQEKKKWYVTELYGFEMYVKK